MSLVRFSPFSELEAVQSQMNRILDELAGWQGESKSVWRPSVELLNGDDTLTLKASLPGISEEDIEVRLTRESVHLSGEYKYDKDYEDHGVYYSEFRHGKFERSIVLPVAIDHENVTADLRDGILSLTLPKIVPTSKKEVRLNFGKKTDPAIAKGSEEQSQV